MRELTLEEQELIAGGTTTDGYDGGDGEIVVTGNPGDGGGDFGDWGDFGDYGDLGDMGDGGSDSPSDPPPPPPEPECDKADNVTGLTAPDGAKYYVPEGMTAEKLNGIINHFTEMAAGRDNPAGLVGAHERVLAEFYDVYTNPNNQYFVDFKDWGTDRGPPGSVSGGQIQYTSEATGGQITASPFEAFGNFFYGFLGTLASISPDELYFAAAALQEGDYGFHDAPEDQPHVNYGIQQALSYAADPHGVLGIENGNCAAGVTGSGTVG